MESFCDAEVTKRSPQHYLIESLRVNQLKVGFKFDNLLQKVFLGSVTSPMLGHRRGRGVVGGRWGGVVGYRRGIGVVGDHDFYGDVSQRREIALIAHRIFLLNPVSQIGRYLMLTGCIIYF